MRHLVVTGRGDNIPSHLHGYKQKYVLLKKERARERMTEGDRQRSRETERGGRQTERQREGDREEKRERK